MRRGGEQRGRELSKSGGNPKRYIYISSRKAFWHMMVRGVGILYNSD